MRKRKVVRLDGAKRKEIARARKRILIYAKRRGSITNDEAREIGNWAQAWYHLEIMRKAGLLRHKDFNLWVPGPRA